MQTFRPSPPRLHAAGKLIHNDDLAILDHIFFVTLVERLGARRRLEVVYVLDARVGVYVVNAEYVLCFFYAGVGKRDLFVLIVDAIVHVFLHARRDRRKSLVERLGV